MAPILSVRNLSTGYAKKQVLFDVMPGEILLITGGNGSGKSTLLKAIYGFLPAWNADAEIAYLDLMKTVEDVRKYAAELGITEEAAMKKGMEEESREYAENGNGIYAKEESC
jgi:ABC-type multidrug transport system ATPase subunit